MSDGLKQSRQHPFKSSNFISKEMANGGIHIVRLVYYTFKRNLAYLFTCESVENL
nr:hypothetical protein [uncultured Campylobacter sp.]